MTTKQVETAVVLGTITGTGNASVTVTAYGMTNSPKTISVAVTSGDTASVVGGLIRTALAFDVDIAAMFLISGSGANVVLTKHVATANDSTVNVAIDNDTCTGLTAAPTSTNTTAGDGLNNAYCALTDVRNLDVLNVSGTSHDDLLTKVINGVSRKIDLYCARSFGSRSETRYYTADAPYCLRTDDIAATSESDVTLELDFNWDGIFEYSIASSNFYLAGYNNPKDDFPFDQIEMKVVSQYSFPVGVRRGVKVTTSFGYASIPEPVNVACILQSNRIWSRFKTPLGQVGTSAIGNMSLTIPPLDPDVRDLLEQYKRLT